MKNPTILVAASVLWSTLMGGAALQAQTNCKNWGSGSFFKRATPDDVEACLASGASVDAPRRKGGLPIHKAAEYSIDPEVLAVLIDAGADPMARTSKHRSTPLHIASGYNMHQKRRVGLVNVLLARGADPNAQDNDGWTPLHAALSLRWNAPLPLVEALLKAGADPNLRTKDGQRPIDWARGKNRSALASAGGVRTPKQSGGGFLGAVIAGVATGAAVASSGADLETTLESVEAVVTGTPPEFPPADASAERPGDGAGMSPEERARRLEEQERARQVQRERQRREDEARRQAEIQQENARILNSNCSCIGIKDNGEYQCLDGLVQGRNPRSRLCDVRR